MRDLIHLTGLCLIATGMLQADDQHFERQVRPLLIAKCVKCHGAEKSEAGLRLDRGEGVARGGDSGEVIRAGKPDESLLIQAVRQTGERKMPPDKKLSAEEIRALEKWVRDGARWPGSEAASASGSGSLVEKAKAALGARSNENAETATSDRGGRLGELEIGRASCRERVCYPV